MPINSYFKGNGNKVMASMKKSNGGNAKAAKREFYATANKRGMKPVKRGAGGMVPSASPLSAGASMRGRGVPTATPAKPYGGKKLAAPKANPYSGVKTASGKAPKLG